MIENPLVTANYIERRIKPRMKCSYPARVKGKGIGGEKIDEEGRVVNLSRCGLYVILGRDLPLSMDLSIKIAMPTGILEFASSRLAIKGSVVRSDPCPGGERGIAVRFENFKYL
jgi:hypothetical protein